ncbi:glycosyltransferase family 2 protein [Thiobacillus sp.]
MDHFDPTLISVVMPCYNAAPTVEAAIGSVLEQSYPHVELVVVDDGSTDGSADILQRLAADHPGRITLVFQSHIGPFAARNAALAHAHGNFIAFLDADDAWQPDALARLHAALEAGPADIAWCGWQAFGIAATDTEPQLPPELDAADAAAHFFEHGPWPLNCLLMRRPLVDDLRGFSERAPSAMDFDLWLRLLAHQPRLARVPEVLAFRRQHPHPGGRIPRWRQVFDTIAVRRDFAHHRPDLVARLTPARLNELIHDPLLREAYRCHWRNDTESARRLFRRAFRKANWKAGDLKHLVASLLPAPLYRNLVDFITRRRSAHFQG